MKNKAVNQKIKAKQKFQIRFIQKRNPLIGLTISINLMPDLKGFSVIQRLSENMKEELKAMEKKGNLPKLKKNIESSE